VDFYAKCILTDLNSDQPETAWKESLNRELTARKGRRGDGKVVAMMISQDKKTAIQVLRNTIPLLLVVVLPAKSIVRYSTVFNDRAAIEQILKKILRSPQK
jgi:sorbitol-specific phosphotransferase system component IIBC